MFGKHSLLIIALPPFSPIVFQNRNRIYRRLEFGNVKARTGRNAVYSNRLDDEAFICNEVVPKT